LEELGFLIVPTFIEITSKPPFRDMKGRFVAAGDEIPRVYQDEARRLGKEMVEIARKEAPRKTGEYASKIRYQTFVSGSTVGFRIYAPEPLTTFIIEGTKPHQIRAKSGGVLAFEWDKGPQGAGMYFFRFVQHPGTKANPFPERSLDKFKTPESKRAFSKISTRFFAKLKGQS